MAACWLSGTWPPKTNVSVPRLTPVRSVRTRTSSGPGSGSVTGRICPRPGSVTQKAAAVVTRHLLNRTDRAVV